MERPKVIEKKEFLRNCKKFLNKRAKIHHATKTKYLDLVEVSAVLDDIEKALKLSSNCIELEVKTIKLK